MFLIVLHNLRKHVLLRLAYRIIVVVILKHGVVIHQIHHAVHVCHAHVFLLAAKVVLFLCLPFFNIHIDLSALVFFVNLILQKAARAYCLVLVWRNMVFEENAAKDSISNALLKAVWD